MVLHRLSPAVLLLALVALPDDAHAAVERAAGFLRVTGEGGELACLPGDGLRGVFTDRVVEILGEANLDPEIAVVLSARPLSCADLFYAPLANDVRGIGYARSNVEELFDDTPDSRLAGVAFLNDLPYWLAEREEFRTAFLHEVGHRFLARVHAEVDGRAVSLTGRDGDHWSYFLETGSSPLEGNHFTGDGPFVTETERYPRVYSSLDLYLMGALAADEVGPLRLLEGVDASGEVDCRSAPLGSSSPPQYCEPKAVSGEWLEFSVEDIVAAEGPRVPVFADAPRVLDVAFILFDDDSGAFDRASCEELALMTSESVADFEVATRGVMTLANLGADGASCAELAFRSAEETGGCSVALEPGRRAKWCWALLALAISAALRRIRTVHACCSDRARSPHPRRARGSFRP